MVKQKNVVVAVYRHAISKFQDPMLALHLHRVSTTFWSNSWHFLLNFNKMPSFWVKPGSWISQTIHPWYINPVAELRFVDPYRNSTHELYPSERFHKYVNTEFYKPFDVSCCAQGLSHVDWWVSFKATSFFLFFSSQDWTVISVPSMNDKLFCFDNLLLAIFLLHLTIT